jgi:hypothetical protein
MKKAFVALLGMTVLGWPVASSLDVEPAQASTRGVYIFNTSLPHNLGLGFCNTGVTKGCIESISVDGISLTPVATASDAHYQVAGGLYSGPCKFIETTVQQCEYPYLVVTAIKVESPNDLPVMTNVEVNFRRKLNSHPTSAINSVVVNGSLQSFSPAAPGVRNTATIRANTADIHLASSGFCRGWVIAIDACAVGDVATYDENYSLSMLLLPGMRSSVVPPDTADATCKRSYPSNDCWVYIFDKASRGGWIDTNASIFGLASTDRFSGAAQLKIAGPHSKAPVNGISELNLANFRMYMPSEFLMNSFGLTPARANSVTLPVKRTARNGTTTPATEYIASADGLLVSTSGIGFSTPTMKVQRVLVVKKNQKVTTTTLLKAAGIFQTKKLGTAKITVNTGRGMRFSSKRYSFKQVRNVKVTIRYQSSKNSTSVRHLTVKVVN